MNVSVYSPVLEKGVFLGFSLYRGLNTCYRRYRRFPPRGRGSRSTACRNRWHPAGKGSLGSRRACLCGGFHLGHGNSSAPASLQTAHDLMGGICPCGPNKRLSGRLSSRTRELVHVGRHSPPTPPVNGFVPSMGLVRADRPQPDGRHLPLWTE